MEKMRVAASVKRDKHNNRLEKTGFNAVRVGNLGSTAN